MILACTQGYLRIPEADSGPKPLYDERTKIRLSVDEALRDRVAKNDAHLSAKELIILGLKEAIKGYETLCKTQPQWALDKEAVEGLLSHWSDESLPYINETLASNV